MNLNNKVLKLEKIITLLFEKRTNLVPSLYEITKKYLNKHDEIFEEILKLRKKEFNNYNENFLIKIHNETLIHHELNFIFKVSLKHLKIQKDERFLLIRDLFLDNSFLIGEKIKLYKNHINFLNKLIYLKNYTIIGYFLNIDHKKEI
ncbi:hypothetical protein H3C61_03275 [Candidatus Gracilibacteria bacterium]|nr:hypothetical protein [Candidatus Gracilibacteria bacterium]